MKRCTRWCTQGGCLDRSVEASDRCPKHGGRTTVLVPEVMLAPVMILLVVLLAIVVTR